MKTYRFFITMTCSEEIEVEAESYDEAFDHAHAEARTGYQVLTPQGYAAYFDEVVVEDSYNPDWED